jgi:hypothetical protein
LATGELGLETDTGKFKVGDGAAGWNSLQYSSGPVGPGLEFLWQNTELGVRVEGQSNYTFVNLKGDTGDTGPLGPPLEFDWDGTLLGVRQPGQQSYSYVDLKGDAATIQVGTVTTGDPFDDALVVNVGSSGDAVFDFVIPQGLKGDPGEGLLISGTLAGPQFLPEDSFDGDGYLINGELWVYSDANGWTNVGQLAAQAGINADGGRADSLYGGVDVFDAGGA